MTIGDVYEQGYVYWLVMLMDTKYCFGDVKEFVYFSDVNEQVWWQMVMSMNRSLTLISDVHG